MAEGTTQEIKTTQFTAKQAVEFGGKNPKEPLLKDLQGLREATGGKSAMEAYRLGDKEAKKLSPTDLEKLNEISIEENKDEANKIHQQLGAINTYCEVAARAAVEGLKPSVILKEISPSENWDSIKTQALEALAETQVMRSIYKGVDTSKRIKLIEEKIASDPKFREAFAQAAKSALSRIDSLPKVTEPEGKQEKIEEKKELQEKIDRHLGSLEKITSLEEKQLRDLFDQELPKEAILEELLQQSLENKDVNRNDIVNIKVVLENEARIKAIGIELGQIDDNISSLTDELTAVKKTPSKDKKSRAEQITTLEQNIETVKLRRGRQEKELKRLRESNDNILNESREKLNIYKELFKKIYGKEASIEEEVTAKSTATVPSFVENLLRELPLLKQKEKEIKALESADDKYQKELKQRGLAETDIIKELKAILNDSVVDFLDLRYDEMTELDKKRISKEQDATLKKFDEDLDKRYIEKTEQGKHLKEIHHRGAIGDDLRLVARLGKEGEKQIVADMLGFGRDPGGWDDAKKAEIERVHAQRGEDLRKRIFTSYFKSRMWHDRSWVRIKKPFSKDVLLEGSTGALSLSEAELTSLGENYKGELESALSASKDAQKILTDLKEKGVNPNINLKWLLYILIALGAIGLFVATKRGG